MSSGGAAAAAAARVPAAIPQGVRKTIQNILEIAGGHTDEEVYAMLRECNMDPNETTQKLLLQDTFHEVKRKRDKKKEGNKEPSDPRWRPGMQGRGGRGGRANYSSRHLSNSSDPGGRNVISSKENGVSQNTDKGSCSPPPVNLDTEIKTSTSISSSSGGIANGPSEAAASVVVEGSTISVVGMPKSMSLVSVDLKGPPPEEKAPASGPDVNHSSKAPPSSVAGSCTSSLDLVPSREPHSLGEVGATKHAIGSQRVVGEYKVVPRDVSANTKDICQRPGSSSTGRPSGSRPSSSYSSRSQQLGGSQKAVPNKEWKPKSTNITPTQPNETGISVGVPMTSETAPRSVLGSNSVHKEDPSMKVDKKLNDLRLSDKQHVIIPNHLQVPESEKYGLSFGSFDNSFEFTVGSSKDPESEECATSPEYESSQEFDQTVDEPTSSDHNASFLVQEAGESGPQQMPSEMPKNISPTGVENSSSTPEIVEPEQPKDASVASEGPQYPVVQAAPSYSTFGLAPQLLGNQTPVLETSEPQTHDANPKPNLVVQQPIDMSTSYHTQLYRPTGDVDGRFSSLLPPGAAIKYGNISVLPAQTGQAQEQGSNSLVQPSSGSTPLATPTAGAVQSSIAIPQQPVPVFRQPVGVHLPHYPANYIPYNQYISPFYLPPPTLHHFLSNAAFPQQPSTGGMYPSPGSAAGAPPVKYSVPPYKPGANTGNPTHVGIPGAYGIYGSSPSGYTSNTAVTSGNSAESDDVSASQFKENNIYIAGQQSEGSAVWIPAAGRDISSLQANSFYGLPPQGQHLAFAPAQAGHGAFGGIYHPAQTLAGAAVHPLLQPSQTVAGGVEMVGPPASVYQQPQRGQMNWANNY